MEFVLMFSVFVYFLFQFLKYFVDENIKGFNHTIKLRLKEFSLQDDCHSILFSLAEQTLRIERTNGYNYHSNAILLPTSYYCYNLYKYKNQLNINKNLKNTSSKLIKKKFLNINNENCFKLINDNNNNNNNNNNIDVNIKKKIEKSKFKYQNWTNPNYNIYRNIYNSNINNFQSEEFDIKELNNSDYKIVLNNKRNLQNQIFDFFNSQYISLFLRSQIFLNNNYSIRYNIFNNYNNNENSKEKNFKIQKKNWKSDDYNNKNNNDYDIDKNIKEVNQSKDSIKSMSSSSTNSFKRNLNKKKHNKNSENKNSKINDYKKFLYTTFDESEDDDSLKDPTYIYSETPSDIEENDLDSDITINKPKDTIYHELYDIMKDVDVIDGLKNQNIIVDNGKNQNSFIESYISFDKENQGIITRSRYQKLLNSNEFLNTNESISSQRTNDTNDTLVSFSKYENNDDSLKYPSTSSEKRIKEKWKNNLKKNNIFKQQIYDLSFEESSISSSSSSNNNSNKSNYNKGKSKKYNTKKNINDPYEFYRRTCVICFDAQREIVLWPCGCLSVCDDCREMMTFRNYKRCPCCQQEVTSYSKINFS